MDGEGLRGIQSNEADDFDLILVTKRPRILRLEAEAGFLSVLLECSPSRACLTRVTDHVVQWLP